MKDVHRLDVWVDSIKYLGIVIDNKLNFNLQIKNIENKISRSKGVIYRMSNFCCQEVLMKLYFSRIYPYITQNIIIWGGVSINKLKHI